MNRALLILTVILSLPSLGQVQKYLGNEGAIFYIFGAYFALFIGYRYILPKYVIKISEKQSIGIFIIFLIFLIIIFSLVYPIVNTHLPGKGSDRDDDLNIATERLLKGLYPYEAVTYLGNHLTHLPGSLILATPFVLLGNSAYQNFFWLFIFFVFLKYYFKDIRIALSIFLIIFILSPVVLQELLTGGDLIANSIYILIFMWLLVKYAGEEKETSWRGYVSAVLLGISLSSRINFIFILPVAFSFILQKKGAVTAIKYTLISLFSFFLITLPFCFYKPSGFSPIIMVLYKLSQFNKLFKYGGLSVVIIIGIITFLTLFFKMNMDNLLLSCFLIQLVPVLMLVIFISIINKRLDLIQAGYGLNFLFFGVPVFFKKLLKIDYNG